MSYADSYDDRDLEEQADLEIARLESELASVKAQLQDWKLAEEAWNRVIATAETNLRDEKTHGSRIMDEFLRVGEENDKLKMELASLKEKLAELETEVEDQNALEIRANITIEQVSKHLAEAEAALTKAQKEIREHEAAAASLAGFVSKHTDIINRRLDELRGKMDD